MYVIHKHIIDAERDKFLSADKSKRIEDQYDIGRNPHTQSDINFGLLTQTFPGMCII